MDDFVPHERASTSEAEAIRKLDQTTNALIKKINHLEHLKRDFNEGIDRLDRLGREMMRYAVPGSDDVPLTSAERWQRDVNGALNLYRNIDGQFDSEIERRDYVVRNSPPGVAEEVWKTIDGTAA